VVTVKGEAGKKTTQEKNKKKISPNRRHSALGKGLKREGKGEREGLKNVQKEWSTNRGGRKRVRKREKKICHLRKKGKHFNRGNKTHGVLEADRRMPLPKKGEPGGGLREKGVCLGKIVRNTEEVQHWRRK